jgi:hypothetical protein
VAQTAAILTPGIAIPGRFHNQFDDLPTLPSEQKQSIIDLFYGFCISVHFHIGETMKTYKIRYTGGFLGCIFFILLWLSVIGIPIAILLIPGLYEIVTHDE